MGNLNLGDVVSVYEVNNGWYRIDQTAQLWCSGKSTYLQRIDETPPTENVLFKARCVVSALYKREGPGKTYKIVGNLLRDDEVSVYEVKYGWYRIQPQQNVWCSGGSQYMRTV